MNPKFKIVSKVVLARGKDIVKRTYAALKEISPKIEKRKILIKPNLVEPMPKDSGAVTRPETVEGIIKFLYDHFEDCEIIVGEGSAIFETERCFEEAGYYEILSKYDVRIVNLNRDEFVKIKVNSKFFPEFEVSKLALESYLISVPALKEHAFEVTLSMKNMMGILKPGKSYPLKSYIHKEEDYKIWSERLCDLISKVKPNLAVIDATTAMFGSHLFGKIKKLDLTIASEDCLAADIVGAEILGHKNVYYLNLALKRKIGNIPTEIKEIEENNF